ncbi:hypothetical protein HZC09_02035 [Candidatus Micrarchaeota archaeon]|nr:hypothetical protein [Candidatus Micrarchaeota archaeon]
MNEDEAQELRKKQIEEFRRMQAEELQKRELMKQILDDHAYGRLSNIRIANKSFYDKLVMLLLSLYRSGQITGRITEKQLLALLNKIQEQRREPEISFKRK